RRLLLPHDAQGLPREEPHARGQGEGARGRGLQVREGHGASVARRGLGRALRRDPRAGGGFHRHAVDERRGPGGGPSPRGLGVVKSKASTGWQKYPWWVQTFTVIGILAVGGVILALFFAVGSGPPKVRATAAPAVESRDFLLAVAGNAGVPVREGGGARLLNNGVEFFPALLKALRDARRTINFSCYIWEKGQASDQVLAALVDGARAGVEVRVLLVGFGGMRARKDGMDGLRAAGGKVETFRAPRLGKLTRFHKRNHRRAIVVDGATGFTGGIAVGDKWLGDADTEKHWRGSTGAGPRAPPPAPPPPVPHPPPRPPRH